ncbi:MAG TPA: hypothetical protein VLA49_11850, partial [Anaerolineales bacterium]|nr:hypothetical protein [Anaerolineales bacterium]
PGAHEVATRLTGIDLVDRLCAGKLKTGAPKFLEEWTCWFNNNRFQRTISIKQTQADKNLIKPLNKEVQDSEKQIKNLNKKLKKPKKLTDSEIKAIQRDIKNLSTKIEQANQKIEQFNLKFGNRIQFMRWRHEAIVVSVENMINGRKVITFETEPGNMGINLRPNQNLQGRDQDVFVGYSPAKELTQQKDERLVEMIRWDKILQAPGYPERMRYQDAISKIIPDGEGITMQEKQLMVINLKGANLPTKKVLNRGSKLFAVQLEKEGVISFRVTRCETEPEAVGAILNSEDVTLLQTCFWVEVKEDTDCKKINSWNKNKFPMFRRSLPKLTLKPDKPFLVSANHQFNPQTDKGGLIRGDGKSFWYLILHHPDHPEAAGLYVSAVPSIPISSPESWETIQSQIQSGMVPGKPSPDETDDTAVEELFMVTKPTGIQLENSLVLPRGSRLFGKISKKGGGKSIQITRNDDFPGSVGQRIESAEATPVKTCLWVKTNKATTGKIIAGFNQNGFPLFKGTSPKVIIPAGTVLLISATHQVSPTDKGGQIQGDGKQFYYLVLEHRGQPEAACLFVFASDLDLLSAPLLWEEAQNQSKDGHTPGVFTEDKDLETGEEELILVIKEAGIELADGQVIPRGAILSAGLIEKGGNEFYLVKKYAALPQATGTMIDSADTSTITQCLWVSPSQDTIPQKIDGWNKKGFPIFIESEGTKLILPKNKPFLVSATHEFNEEDAGGVIKGNGGKNCYLIIEHESQPAAAGLYVLAKAVTLKTKPQPWEAIQAEKDAVANPPTETPFGPQ